MTFPHATSPVAYVSSGISTAGLQRSAFITRTKCITYRGYHLPSPYPQRPVRCSLDDSQQEGIDIREKADSRSVAGLSGANGTSAGNGASSTKFEGATGTSADEGMIFPSRGKNQVDTGYKRGKADYARAAGVTIIIAVVAALLQHSWIDHHRDLAMEIIFVLGYLAIILEESLSFDKSGVALLMGVGVWTVLRTAASGEVAGAHVSMLLGEQLGDVSQILFFLIGAMTIVEIIDAHRGFKVITDFITTNNKKILLWTIGVLTFFISAVLDNLTSTIVVVSLLRKLVANRDERLLYGAAAVIAANAGGAWTPIGDVTTTQLWVHGNITALSTMVNLFLPSFASLVVSLAIMTPNLDGDFDRPEGGTGELAPRAGLVFWTGLAALVSVPVFKAVTGLPPYLGMLSGLGTLWVITDAIHAGENRESLRGLAAVKRIDTSSVLFFLGILLAVGGLESAGILSQLAHYLDANVGSRTLIATAVGLLSAVIDNVPLVAATMGMYSLDEIKPDSSLWQLIAFCAGTGGSILVIGSAAGVAYMGMEKVDFGWYARKVSLPTAAGFFAGIGTYLLTHGAHLPSFATAIGH